MDELINGLGCSTLCCTTTSNLPTMESAKHTIPDREVTYEDRRRRDVVKKAIATLDAKAEKIGNLLRDTQPDGPTYQA
jgi:hypothetical protein